MVLARLDAIGVLSLVVLSVPGCGGGASDVTKPPSDEIALIANTVSQVPDAARRPQSLKNLFVKDGTIPSDADRKKMERMYFEIVGTPKIKDGVATAEVQVRNSANSDPPSKAQWTLVKENELWKLKTAPLP